MSDRFWQFVLIALEGVGVVSLLVLLARITINNI